MAIFRRWSRPCATGFAGSASPRRRRNLNCRAALKALVATLREELQSLRRQVEGLSEALRQQRLVDGRQLGELSQRYGELLATYREFRVQADTIYAAFEHLRSTGLTGLWRVFGPTIR